MELGTFWSPRFKVNFDFFFGALVGGGDSRVEVELPLELWVTRAG
jgi:hypothetical protein